MLDVDHVIYTVPDLAEGVAEIERLLGVRPVAGGRHPRFGTHNALVSLGASTYLEIIARDPDSPQPARGTLFGLDRADRPRLATWVLRREDIDAAARAAADGGLALGPVQTGGRTRPDGTALAWRVTDPYAMPLAGAVPFLIAWGETPHPAAAAPRPGELSGLRIEHPEPERVRSALAALDADAELAHGDRVRLIASIRTPAGIVEIA